MWLRSGSKIAVFDVAVYCPFCLVQFSVNIEAPTAELARRKAVGATAVCPKGHEFELEDLWILHVYPLKTVAPPPYDLMSEEDVKEARWLKGAMFEEPLPKGSRPEGSPKLATIIPDALTSFIYRQKVTSKEYPEYTGWIQYRRDIFTKFYEEAKRMRRTHKIEEAVLYLIEHCPGITIRMISDALGIGYWTAWRAVAKLARPEEEELKRMKPLLDETASLERWTTSQKEEVAAELARPKEPKAVVGPLWRGELTLYPIRPKSEEELLEELRRILTLEGYPKMTPEEEEETAKAVHRYWQLKKRERLTAFFAQE